MREGRPQRTRTVLIVLGVLALASVVMLGVWYSVTGVPGLEEARTQRIEDARTLTRPESQADQPQPRETLEETQPVVPTADEPERKARTVPEVLRTPFVPKYRAAQPEIAGPQFRKTYHPDDDLASDGLDICHMLEDPDITLTQMIEDFTNYDHPHKGPVTPMAAMQTYRMAIEYICPDLNDEFETKKP